MQMQQNVEEIQQAAANSYQYPVLASTENLNSRDPSGGKY